jgi:arylsulfatase A-like enzyme/tetratricopeptide (TPR) repeat protein
LLSCRRVAVALTVLIAAACGREKARTPVFPNAPVIVISIDTLRADHLPAYGYKQVETPNIDRLRADAILFENAYAHVPLTLPSHVSMLTGALPPDNGVRNNIGYPFDAAAHETIPSLLKKNGYATGAAVSAYVLRGGTGIRGAFDFYDDDVEVRGGESQGELQRDGNATEAIAERWVGEHASQPFFFMLHLFEPHSPYTPPEPFRSRFALPYDGEIAAADAVVGHFIEFLKQRGLYDRAVIVLMSDHGEGLAQHGEDEHGIFLYREDLHVPLMLKLPKSGSANTAVAKPVGLIDIFPTVAALTGITPPKLRGVSLLDAAAHAPRSQYAETLYPRIHLGWSDLRSLMSDKDHLIVAPRPELYDVVRDPAERTNVLDAERRTYTAMRQELDAYGTGVTAPSKIDPEEAKKLAALGYLSSTPATPSGPLPDPKDRIGEIAMLREAGHRDAAGDFAGAIAGFRAVLAKNPALTDAWTLLAKAQEKSGDYAGAIESYKRAIQLAPSLAAGSALSIASMSLNLDRLEDAEAHARLAESGDPSNARVILGRVALAKRDLPAAEARARSAVEANPRNSVAQVFLAQVLTDEHRFDEAMQIIQTLQSEHAGGQPVALADFVRGDILARTGHPDEAKALFAQEIRNFPAERQAYASLTAVFWFSGQRAEALKTMEFFVHANPGPASSAFAAKTFDDLGDPGVAASFRSRARQP